MKKVFALSLLLIFALSCAFSSGSSESSPNAKTVVKVGVCGASNDYWNAVQKNLDEEGANIYIELVEFSQYTLPNEALNTGDIDLNSFQHVAFLNNEIAKNGYDLTIIGDTIMAPLTLYSRTYSSLDELKYAANASKDALKIGVPNDATNQSRAIKLLETAGLITVDPAAGYTPETKDITGHIYNVEVTPVDANTLPTLVNDFAACVINGTYAIPAGFVPSRDGLIIERQNEGSDNPYRNIVVARTSEKDNPVFKTIIEALQRQNVAEYILQRYNEAYFPVFDYDPAFTPSEEFVNEIASYKSSKTAK